MSISGSHLEPLHWFCRVFAVWPFEGNISITSLDVYFRFIILILSMYSAYFYYIIIIESPIITNMVVWVSYLFEVTFHVLQYISIFVTGFLNSNKMKNILRSISSVNEELKETGIKVECKRFYLDQIIIISVFVLVNLPQYYFMTHRAYPPELVIYPSLYTNYVQGATPLMFMGLSHVLEVQIKFINNQLDSLFDDLVASSSEDVLSRLKKLIKIHIDIRGIIQNMNFAFEVSLLLYMSYNFTEASAALLSVLQSTATYNFPKKARRAWLMYFAERDFIVLLLLTEICHSAALEV